MKVKNYYFLNEIVEKTKEITIKNKIKYKIQKL